MILRAIVFDLDGVLVNSEPLMRFAFAQSYERVIGEGVPPIEAYLEHMGESFPHIMDHLGLPHTLWQPYREICQQYVDRIEMFPKSLDVLRWARDQQLKLGILTGKDRERTLQLLELFELRDYFDAIVASDQLQRSKPDPEGMYLSLELLSCAPDEAVMIGDAVSDIECAQKAGVCAVAVTWGIKPERVQTMCHPDYIVHSWEDLSLLLNDLLTFSPQIYPGLPYEGLARLESICEGSHTFTPLGRGSRPPDCPSSRAPNP
jgi:3-amino-5-hydroxybenzoic acid synthesis related protein